VAVVVVLVLWRWRCGESAVIRQAGSHLPPVVPVGYCNVSLSVKWFCPSLRRFPFISTGFEMMMMMIMMEIEMEMDQERVSIAGR